MKLSNRRIVEETQIISKVSQKELPVKVSYAIAKNIGKIQSELKVYNAQKEKLIEKYAEKDEQGKVKVSEQNQLTIIPENIDSWNKDLNELLDIENEIDIHKFSFSLLEGYNISPAELMAIDYMIEE